MTRWTEAQKQAIDSEGGTLLVSAAAGSGKTAVLVERVIRKVTEKHGCDLDELLIVTFTNAAAAEMRERIGKAISERIAKDAGNPRLLRQQMLLPGAEICTIDAFCQNFVREHFYMLGIGRDYSIIDSADLEVMENEVLACVLDECYEQGKEGFYHLVELLSSSKNDAFLMTAVKKLYTYIMAHPFPEAFLDEICAKYEEECNDISQTVWGALLFEYAKTVLAFCRDQLDGVLTLFECDEILSEKFSPLIISEREEISALLALAAAGGWDAFCARLHAVVFQRAPSVRGYADHPDKTSGMAKRKLVKENIVKLQDLFTGSSAENCRDIGMLRDVVRALTDTVRLFMHALSEEKQRVNLYSFADVEHFALDLLVSRAGASYVLSDLAKDMKSRYREILVDEYQDTNKAQDMLFEALSNGKNLFMVGDVKQSIYRFRQAMPQIFTEKKNAYHYYETGAYPAKIILDKNFRSREGVCDFINFVFRNLMSAEVGELEYNSDEALHAGTPYPALDLSAVEMHILENQSEKQTSADELEGAYIAALIRQKVESGELICDKNMKIRPVEYGDFAILMRSANQHMSVYAEQMKKAGVPVTAQDGMPLFECPEILTVVSLLRVLDNAMQDIPLLAVMMSPIFGFTGEELSRMRIENRHTAFYTCVVNYAASHGGKAAAFLAEIDRLRMYCGVMPLAALIRKIYDVTSYIAVAASMGNARQRRANLLLFAEIADTYEKNGKKGLSSFIRMIDRMDTGKSGTGSAQLQGADGNAVQIMSVHRSKGLEFPICILAGCARAFNNQDLNDRLLVHPELGAGMKVLDPSGLYYYNSIAYNAVRIAIKNAEKSESLRVLYVAMTRARVQLITVMTFRDVDKKLEKAGGSITGNAIDSFVVGSAACEADWLLGCALLHKDGGALRAAAGINEHALSCQGDLSVQIVRDFSVSSEEEQADDIPVSCDEGLVSQIRTLTAYRYPHAALSGLAAKRTASSLDEAEFEYEYFAMSRPSFMEADGLSAAQKGSAVHAFMQHCDYNCAHRGVSEEALRLLHGGFLSQKEFDALDIVKLDRFFAGSFAARIFASDKVLREIRFSTFVKANEIYDVSCGDDEKIFVQGIADCVFIEDGEFIVVDYKTDQVSSEQQLLGRYEKQIGFYAKALERMLKMPVKEIFLYSFYLDKPIRYNP